MNLIKKVFIVFSLLFVVLISYSIQSSFALDHVNFQGKTEKFTKQSFSKEFTSTGEPIYLTIYKIDKELSRDPDKIDVILKRKGVNGWEKIEERKNLKVSKEHKFEENIRRGDQYRFDFRFPEENTFGSILSYHIDQREPKADKYPVEIDDLVPEIDLKNKKVSYTAKKDGKKVSVVGNLSYSFHTISGVTYVKNKKSIPLNRFESRHWPQKEIYNDDGKVKEKGTVERINVTFVGDDYYRLKDLGNGYDQGSIRQFGRTLIESNLTFQQKHGTLKIDQKTDANKGTLTVTAKNPVKISNPSNAKTNWTFQLIDKDTKKKIGDPKTKKTASDKKSATVTFERSNFENHKNVQIEVKLDRLDIKSNKTNDQATVLTGEKVVKAKEIPDKPKDPPKSEDPPKDPPKSEDPPKDPPKSEDPPKDKPKDKPKDDTEKINKEAKIEISSEILENDRVKVIATVKNAQDPKGNWKLTFHNEEPRTYNDKKGETIEDIFSIETISQKNVAVTVEFKGKDAEEQKINLNVTEQIAIKDETSDEDDDDDKINEEAKIEISSEILENDRVKVIATVKNAQDPKGNWKLIFHNEEPRTYDDKYGGTIEDIFSTKAISQKNVAVTVEFEGKDAEEQKINLNVTEQIAIKDETSDEDEDVAETKIDHTSTPTIQGGELPKTANVYATSIIIGFILLTTGFIIFRLRRIS